jgi:hypothetical protein
MVVFIDDI